MPHKAQPADKKVKHDNIYRLSNISINEISRKYPDLISNAWMENGCPVLELDNIRIKYTNKDQKVYSNTKQPVSFGVEVEG